MLKSTGMTNIKGFMDQVMKTNGALEEIWSDGGPPYNGQEWKKWVSSWGSKLRTLCRHWITKEKASKLLFGRDIQTKLPSTKATPKGNHKKLDRARYKKSKEATKT